MARKKRSSKKTITEGKQVKAGRNTAPTTKRPPKPDAHGEPESPKNKELGESQQPKKTEPPSQDVKVSFGWDETIGKMGEAESDDMPEEEDFGLPKVENIPPMPEIVPPMPEIVSEATENTIIKEYKVEPDERFPEPEKPKQKKETVADIHERSVKSDKRQRVWAKIKGFFSSDMDVEQYTILKLVANILTTFNFLVNFATLLAILYASYVLMTILCIDGALVSTDSIVRLAGLFLFILTMIFIHERIDS